VRKLINNRKYQGGCLTPREVMWISLERSIKPTLGHHFTDEEAIERMHIHLGECSKCRGEVDGYCHLTGIKLTALAA
jgi:hypothetical protein